MKRSNLWRAALVLGSLALMAAILAALELAARRFGGPEARFPQYAQYLQESWGPFFRVKRDGGQVFVEQIPRHPYAPQPPQVFLRAKSPNTLRIILVGESSARNLGKKLASLAKDFSDQKTIEFWNAAMGGDSLEQVEARFDEIKRYDPDAVVVLFGNNLLYRHGPPPIGVSPWVVRLGGKLRLLGFLRRRMADRDLTVYRRKAPRVKAFARFIRRIKEDARERKFKLFLCTVPSNLWRRPLLAEGKREDPAYLRAIFDFWRGRIQEAIRILQRDGADTDPRRLFALGDWLYEEGRYAEARRYLKMARDAGEDNRAPEALNRLVRAQADGREAILVDLERLIETRSPHGIPGWTSFWDAQHTRWTELEAAVLLETIGRVFHIEANSPKLLNANRQGQDYRSSLRRAWGMRNPHRLDFADIPYLTVQGAPESRAAIEAGVSALGLSPRERCEVLWQSAEGFWRAGRKEDALALLDEAQKLDPRSERPMRLRAMFFTALRRDRGALAQARDALAIDPDDALMRYFRERLLVGIGAR